MCKTLNGRLQELKNKGKGQLGNPKLKVVAVIYLSGGLRELFITKLKSQFKRGFTKVVITGAGRLRE